MIIYTTTKKDLGNGSAKILDMFNLIGFSFKKMSSFLTSIYVYPGIFIDTYREVVINLEIKGKDYSHSNLVDKIRLFFKNIKIVFKKSNDKMKSRKVQMKYRLYKSNVKSKYKYRNKLCIFDYIFIIVNIGIVVFYVLKVRL
jgi:energy-coupling factor transporter transmembrane protein EcfT